MSEALANKPRLLSKVIPSLTGASAAGVLSFTSPLGVSETEGWNILDINNSTQEAFVWQGYLDLAGYEIEQLTFFLQGINVAENQMPAGLGNVIHISDLITKTPITEAQLNREYYLGQAHYAPGFGYSLHNMDEVLMGRKRSFYHDQNWTLENLQLLAAENRWGDGDSTAAGRIYLTRIVTCASDEAALIIPNADYQVVGVALEEDDLDYIMRLRRDYELAS